ncbi:MAG: MOSC domain-containing protein [Pseudomonadota bacterium]
MSGTPSEGTVKALYHYPIKGLSAQPLSEAPLVPGKGFPHDRVLALARAKTEFDPRAPKPLRKGMFHMLARDASLARLKTHYDATADTLQIDNGAGPKTFSLGTESGANEAAAYISEALSLAQTDTPRLVRADGHRFTDVSVVSETFMNAISLINLASVHDLGARAGETLDPIRFRGNVYFDGWAAWDELSLEGRAIALGETRLRVLLRTERCAATTVNPQTAERDVPVPRLLRESFGHADCGIYAEVLRGGTIRAGDPITVSD